MIFGPNAKRLVTLWLINLLINRQEIDEQTLIQLHKEAQEWAEKNITAVMDDQPILKDSEAIAEAMIEYVEKWGPPRKTPSVTTIKLKRWRWDNFYQRVKEMIGERSDRRINERQVLDGLSESWKLDLMICLLDHLVAEKRLAGGEITGDDVNEYHLP